MRPLSNTTAHFLASLSLLALISLCLLWELWLAPLKPGGSWMALKCLPLLLPLKGLIRRDNYTMQWTSMLVLLYFTEGIVRASSDLLRLSRYLAGVEIALSLILFAALLSYLRPLKQAHKAQQRAAAMKKTAKQELL